jgi:rifampicin phosphotransferase
VPLRFVVNARTERIVDGPVGSRFTERLLQSIGAVARQVEERHGSPREIEWAAGDDGPIRVLDSRPLRVPFPLLEPRRDGLRVYFCLSIYRGVPRPMTPMGLAALRIVAASVSELVGLPVADRTAGPSGFVTAGQRMFVDVTAAVRSSVGRHVLGRAFAIGEARSAEGLRRLTQDPRLSVVQRSPWPLLRGLGHLLVRGGMPRSVLGALVRPTDTAKAARARLADLDRQWTADPSGGPVDDLDHVESVLGEVIPVLAGIVSMALLGYGLLGYGLLGVAGLLSGTPRDELQAVLRSLPNNPTTEMGIELWEMGRRIRADADACRAVTLGSTAEIAARFRAGTLPAVAQNGIAAFLDRHGRRAVVEIDVGVPRWSEDPAVLIAALRGHVMADETAATPGTAFARGAAEAEVAIEEIAARAGRRGGGGSRRSAGPCGARTSSQGCASCRSTVPCSQSRLPGRVCCASAASSRPAACCPNPPTFSSSSCPSCASPSETRRGHTTPWRPVSRGGGVPPGRPRGGVGSSARAPHPAVRRRRTGCAATARSRHCARRRRRVGGGGHRSGARRAGSRGCPHRAG